MIKLIFERITLLSALSALILAVFWPHVGPKIRPFLVKFLVRPLIETIGISRYTRLHRDEERAIKQDHPKFSGRTLKRMTSEKESLRFAYKTLDGFGQTPLSGNPSFSLNLVGSSGSGHPTRGQSGTRSEQSSTVPLTIFTVSIIVLIIYIMMKMLTARFSNHQMQTNHRHMKETKLEKDSKDDIPYRASYRHVTNDLQCDKRKLARMSREEKARELILRHGGKNVSSAIRFLVAELEKQKQLLCENLSEKLPCNCSCHASQQLEKGSSDNDNELASKGKEHDGYIKSDKISIE